MLLHLVDVSSERESDPAEEWRVVDAELALSSPELYAKPRLIVATKCEDETANARADGLARALAGRSAGGCDTTRVLRISSVLGDGLRELLLDAHRLVRPRE